MKVNYRSLPFLGYFLFVFVTLSFMLVIPYTYVDAQYRQELLVSTPAVYLPIVTNGNDPLSGISTPTMTSTPTPTITGTVSVTPTNTFTPTPTNTPTPTATTTSTPTPTDTSTATSTPTNTSTPTVATDLRRIVFVSERDGNSEIYSMKLDGSEQTRLTNTNSIVEDYDPTQLADGNKIAFVRKINFDGDIWTMNRDGSSQTTLITNLESPCCPIYSSNGTKMAFSTNICPGCTFEIMVANFTDGSLQRLTFSISYLYPNSNPTWSPDAIRIVYAAEDLDTQKSQIYVMSSDGTAKKPLTNTPTFDVEPDWSPNGKLIVFTSDRDGNKEIYVMNSDGTGQTRLTNNSTDDSDPVWAPDGAKIAFTSKRDGNREIYVMSLDGSGQTRLTNNSADDYDPDW